MRNSATAMVCLVAGLFAFGCGNDDNPNMSAFETDLQLMAPGGVAALHDSEDESTATYRVDFYNLATGQPFSPPVAATHRKSFRMFKVGRLASPGLERIAEDGNNMPMFDRFNGSEKVTEAVNVGVPLTPMGTTVGAFSDNVSFMIRGSEDDRFSIATMLICTNDGFTGLNSVKLPEEGSETFYLKAYDAGTEANTEASEDIVDACSALGPSALAGDPNGNEDDAVDSSPHTRIRRHDGIQGSGDLGDDHSWEGAVGKVVITRMEVSVTYTVTIQNLSEGQPIAPIVAATHNKKMRMFKKGKLASAELEAMAETGNPGPIAGLLAASDKVTDVYNVGMPLTPYGTMVGAFRDNVTFEIVANDKDRLSLAGMLICTNDGITGLNAVKLPKSGYRVYYAKSFDAGTEDNTELSGDIVDACSGLGPLTLVADPNGNDDIGPDSSPHDEIEKHDGIQGNGDLSVAAHGWDDPVLKVTVTRVTP